MKSERTKHPGLPLSGRVPVTAHRRQDERQAPLLLDGRRKRGQHLDHAAHPAAAGCDQHRLPELDGIEQARALQLFPGAAWDIQPRSGFEILFKNVIVTITKELTVLMKNTKKIEGQSLL